mgnify:CR=1 FL=1
MEAAEFNVWTETNGGICLIYHRICNGFDDGNRIGDAMWGEVNLICAVELNFLILPCFCARHINFPV